MLGRHDRATCSDACQREAGRGRAADHRRQTREAVTPESFTCIKCKKEIEGTIAFWWEPDADWRQRALVPWCESCFVETRTDQARERFEDAKETGGRDFFGRRVPDPDAKGFDPLEEISHYDPAPCAGCGRIIRWSYAARPTSRENAGSYCSAACQYEASKAARRVKPSQRKCKVCGKTFTPKRSDAKTCTDRCRQALRRRKRKPSRKPASAGDRGHHPGAAKRDTAKRSKKPKARTRGTSSKARRRSPVKPKSDTTPICGWDGCEKPATHRPAMDMSFGLGGISPAYAWKTDSAPSYCKAHCELEVEKSAANRDNEEDR